MLLIDKEKHIARWNGKWGAGNIAGDKEAAMQKSMIYVSMSGEQLLEHSSVFYHTEMANGLGGAYGVDLNWA